MDFTIKKYKMLLLALKENNYSFQTYQEFLIKKNKRSVVLRHDVDLLPENSYRFAKIQNQLGIKGSYYFRAVPESWNEEIIVKISKLGHEVGYHYETMDSARGNMNLAMDQFKKHLEELRKLVEVRTICMHGSPLSKYDNRDLWKEFDYKEFGIIGEPYFDVNYNKVFYLTDTGRRWDGNKYSVRDKVESSFDLTFHSTDQIKNALNNSVLPDHIMITFHPQRWNSNILLWTKELLLQNIKNSVKRYIYVKRDN